MTRWFGSVVIISEITLVSNKYAFMVEKVFLYRFLFYQVSLNCLSPAYFQVTSWTVSFFAKCYLVLFLTAVDKPVPIFVGLLLY